MAEFTFDGRRIPFQDDDTLASALHRAGVLELSRSMKYHRPRGAYCFDGGCAGCLVDVDGRPNVLACLEPATACKVASQNRIGSAKRDLLGVTDKVYRRGFDPHGAFTRPRWLNAIFLRAVRFMSGVGRAPRSASGEPLPTAHRMQVDEIIIGSGTAGLRRAAQAKGRVVLVEEADRTGGSARHDPDDEANGLQVPDHVDVWVDSLAFGIYDDGVAVRRGDELWHVQAERITLAPGRHQGWPLFANNDLPGVISLRGAKRLWHGHGILPGRRIVWHGPRDEAFLRQLTEAGARVMASGDVTAAKGGTRVEKAQVATRWFACDVVICHVPGTPRIELAQQAGCRIDFHTGLLAPRVEGTQTSRPDVHWVAG